MTVAGLVLAAGAGSRMGLPKALVKLPNGLTMLVNAIQILRDGGCDEIVVVVGAGESYVRRSLEAHEQQINQLMGSTPLTIVSNPLYAEGISTSVRLGLNEAAQLSTQPDAVVVQLVDTPDISPDAVQRVSRDAGPQTIAVATYDGNVAHPMVLGRNHWGGIADAVHGDVGARAYLGGHPDLQRIECDGLGSPIDIDTPAALAARAARNRVQTEVVRAEVTEESISVSFLEILVRDRRAGAVVTFSGIVRDHDQGRSVEALHYMAHPSADEVIKTIAREVADAGQARHIAVAHRVGPLQIGDIALGCAVSADHRDQAFEACSILVERVKAELPVWKRQVFDDGTDEWVNAP